MTCPGDPETRRLRWSFGLLLGVTALGLMPVFQTGYIQDDATQSLFPGFLRVEGTGLWEYLARSVTTYTRGGRFFPLHLVYLYTFFYCVRSLALYKALVVAGVLADVVLFRALVARVSKDRALGNFAACLVVPLFQFRAFFDPILSFFCLLQVVAAGLMASLLGVQRFLDTGRRRWLAFAAATYLVVMLLYEVTYPLFLLHVLLIAHGRRGWRDRVAASLPFVGLAALCVLSSAVVRRLAHLQHPLYQINANPLDVGWTVLKQTSSALPLSYFLTGHTPLLPKPWDLTGLVRFVAEPGALAVFAGVAAACLISLRVGASAPGGVSRGRTALLAGLGLLLAVLPALLISISLRYQRMIHFGVGYLPVYLQYFGVALLFGALAWSARRGGWLPAAARVALALLVGATAGLTYRANATIAGHIAWHPDEPGFDPVVGGIEASWNRNRALIESALHAGLLDDVPEHSVVRLVNEYSYWHDILNSRYFYALHTGKSLEVSPLTDKLRRHEGWFTTRSGVDTFPATEGDGPPYLLREVCVGDSAGYVVLSRSPAPGTGGADEVRLFVRHPKLFEGGRGPTFAVYDERPADAGEGPGRRFERLGRDLSVVRSGRDWAVVAFRVADGAVDPGALAVAFGTVATGWGHGFSFPEADPGLGRWRWCGRDGVVYLVNSTGVPRKVRLSLVVQNKGDGPIVLEGGPLRADLPPAPRAVRFERELTLPPGTNPLTLRTTGSRVETAPADRRDLFIRVWGLTLRDLSPGAGAVRR